LKIAAWLAGAGATAGIEAAVVDMGSPQRLIESP
jgi:hypothetical protein